MILSLCAVLTLAPATAYANDPPALGNEDLWINYAAGSYAGGTGTEDDPYQIATAEQLAKLARDVYDGPGMSYVTEGKYYKLTANIDLSGHNWYPIGTMANNTIIKNFAGVFDGNGCTISGMNIQNNYEQDSKNGLFGGIASLANFTSEVKNLTISDASIQVIDPQLTYIGILVGDINCAYPVEVNDVHVSGSIGTNAAPSVGAYVGGFVGAVIGSSGTLSDCR